MIDVSEINGAPSLVSVLRTVPHRWHQWEKQCPIVDVSSRNVGPLLVSVRGMESCISGRKSTPRAG